MSLQEFIEEKSNLILYALFVVLAIIINYESKGSVEIGSTTITLKVISFGVLVACFIIVAIEQKFIERVLAYVDKCEEKLERANPSNPGMKEVTFGKGRMEEFGK